MRDLLYPLRRLHGLLAEGPELWRKKREYRRQIRQIFEKNPRTVFLTMTPEHGNLGDHAITLAVQRMLKNRDIAWIEVPCRNVHYLKNTGLLSVLNGYPILINGGGNLGTLWPETEELQRELIHANPRSAVYILPNTCFYEDSSAGRAELERTKKRCGSHPCLRIYAREEISYDFLREHFRNVKLVPDMVLSLSREKPEGERRGAVLCLRSDCERTRSRELDEKIRSQVRSLFGDQVEQTDTVLAEGVAPEDRARRLEQLLERFASAELVVTDRLHGMIFCAVTGTPCVVVNSRSPKVLGCYRWLARLPYIRVAEDGDILTACRQIPEGPFRYDPSELEGRFRELEQDLEQIWR